MHTYLFHYILCLLTVIAVFSCSDNDDAFSSSPANILTFDIDTVRMDTVFSNVPSSTRSFWIHNNSDAGIKCSNVRLQHGNQVGFRVNVDGIYLGETYGYQTNDIQIRKGDSIRVFVELTSPYTGELDPQEIEDNLIFTLESGVQQTVNLNAWTWDAEMIDMLHVESDTLLDNASGRPIIIRGGITVDSLATLTLAAGSTLYFHDNAGIDVYGRLKCEGSAEQNVILRGDRIDRMFDYLPYDNLAGRWQGVRIHSSSYGNVIDYTDIHSAMDGIVCDSCDVGVQTLSLSNSTIHNCQGYGLLVDNANVDVANTQITNTLHDCVMLNGGILSLLHTTMAQFYPFDARRGAALRFTGFEGRGMKLNVTNSIITGYADDVVMAERGDTTAVFDYHFAYSLLRTPEVDDSLAFDHVVWEDVTDTVCSGVKNFKKVDIDLLRYDFHLDSLSKARGSANPAFALPYNRDGLRHEGGSVSMGCY